jgi:hypothetical protein
MAARRLRKDVVVKTVRMRVTLTTAVAMLSLASPAAAQTRITEPTAVQNDATPSLGQVFTGTLANFRNLPTRENMAWLLVGGGAAAAVHPLDSDTSNSLTGSDGLHEPFEAGAVIGGTPLQLGTAFATYGIGRALRQPRVARLGAELIQAQLMAETLSFAVKHVVRRERPDGSSYSFPSGHTTVSFASASVLRRTFGWKVGAPAYAVASYVAASRIQSQRHYLSDVVFGAALGTVAGRTVPVGRSQRLAIHPAFSPDGAALSFSLHQSQVTSRKS